MEALNEQFGTSAEFEDPKGGIFLWVKLPDNVDTLKLYQAALAAGVAINPGPEWSTDKAYAGSRLRLCFASPSHEQIREGVAVLAEVCRKEFGVPARIANVEKHAPHRARSDDIRTPQSDRISRMSGRRFRSIARALPLSWPPPWPGARRHSSHGCFRSIPGPSCSGEGCSAAALISGHSGADARPGRSAGFDQDGKERLAGRLAVDAGHGVFHPLPAADQRVECRDHHRNGTVRRRRACLDMASRSRRAGEPCWRASWRSAASPSSSATRAPVPTCWDRAGLLHDRCDRGHDGRGPAAQEHADGGGRRAVEPAGQRRQHSLRPRHSRRDRQPTLFILAMFGFFQVALGLTLFVLGSRLLPSGQATLIATLETPLMPFWVWLAFQEVPATRALVGGALVMGAVIADIIGDSRAQKTSAVISPAVTSPRTATDTAGRTARR